MRYHVGRPGGHEPGSRPKRSRSTTTRLPQTHDAFDIRRNAAATIRDSRVLRSPRPGVAVIEVHVEHHVKARPVKFVNGTTGPVLFELINPPTTHGRVDIHDLSWQWESRLGPHHAWHKFDITRHRM
jgi:hypothetical protein